MDSLDSTAPRRRLPRKPKRLLGAAVAAAAVSLALAPAALANKITVDDDRAECPVADYTTLPEAVAAAAQGDDIYICDGTYEVPGGANSSGLKIEKNIDLIGAGADKVFVQPDGSSPTMSGATANPRDEFGNIITVKRRTVQLFHVGISGLTVRGAGTAAEGGIAMIDVNESSIEGVRIEGMVPDTGAGTGDYAAGVLAGAGDGLILAQTTESDQNEATVDDVEITGFNNSGILVDNRLLNGAGDVGNESRIIADIDDTTITGGGTQSAIYQDGIEVWGSGASLELSGSVISGTGASSGNKAAILMRGADVPDSLIGGSIADGNDLSANFFGIASYTLDGSGLAADVLAATRNWFGPIGPGADAFVATSNVTWKPAATSAPAAPPALPAPVNDAAPVLQWDERPQNGSVVDVDVPIDLAALATDDFGVNSVEFFAGGESLGVSPTPALDGDRIYTGSWTPTAADSGAEVTLKAVATDSAGQTSTVTVDVTVADVIAPDTAITAGPAEGATIDDPTPTFEFTSTEAGSTFECSVDGAAPASCATPFTTAALADGTHSFAVQATDASGNTDPTPATRSFTVDTEVVVPPPPPPADTTAPDTVITKKPAKKTKKKTAKFKFAGIFSDGDPYEEAGTKDPGATFECKLDKKGYKPCSSPKKYRKLKKGKHTFKVRATDEAGNTDSTAAVYKWKVKPKHHKKKGGKKGKGKKGKGGKKK